MNQEHPEIQQAQQQLPLETQMRILNEAQRQIWITFQHEGMHQFRAAADAPKLQDVAFLAHPHRHMFHFRVSIDVFHNDRDIEFIQFKRWCEGLYNTDTLVLNHKSGEMIADDLYVQIGSKYPNRNVTIEVSDDGENGCAITYNIHQPSLSIKI